MGHQLKGCSEDGFVYCFVCKQEMPRDSVYVIPCIELAWTTKKPTKPGWYWYKGNVLNERLDAVLETHEEPVMLCVEKWASGKLRAQNAYPDYELSFSSMDEMPGQWAGPLEPPV